MLITLWATEWKQLQLVWVAPAHANDRLDNLPSWQTPLLGFEVMHYSQLRVKSQQIRCVLMIQLLSLPLLHPAPNHWTLCCSYCNFLCTDSYTSVTWRLSAKHYKHFRFHLEVISGFVVFTASKRKSNITRAHIWDNKFPAFLSRQFETLWTISRNQYNAKNYVDYYLEIVVIWLFPLQARGGWSENGGEQKRGASIRKCLYVFVPVCECVMCVCGLSGYFFSHF